MPRNLYQEDPEIINFVNTKTKQSVIEVATGNKGKLNEIERILKGYKIVGKDLKMEEIQSLNPHKVAEHKAKEAWKANGYNPILIEDVSLELKGLGGRPGTYVNDFCGRNEENDL